MGRNDLLGKAEHMQSMPLSQAIRLGAMLKPQGFGAMLEDGKTCAIGGAMEAVGVSAYGSSMAIWPWAAQPTTHTCPECGYGSAAPFGLLSVIAHINDDHRWTREQIADWVETIERELSPSAGEATTQDVATCSVASEPVLP